jgi:hypothetical protein
MKEIYKDRGCYPTRAEDWAYSQPIADLLRKQRQGKFLTPLEKERIKKEAEAKRKANLKK